MKGTNGSILQQATYSASVFNCRQYESALDSLRFQIKLFLMEQFELLASSCQNSSACPPVTEAEHVIGLIEMTFPRFYGEGHLRVRVSRC